MSYVRRRASLALLARELERRLRSLQRRLRLLEETPKRCRTCPFAEDETCEPFRMRKLQVEAAMQGVNEDVMQLSNQTTVTAAERPCPWAASVSTGHCR